MPLPKFEDYKAPWETAADGQAIAAADQTLDPERLKKLFYNTLVEKEKAQTGRDTALAANTELSSKVKDLEGKVEAKATENLSDIEKLTASVAALTTRAEKAEFEKTKLSVFTAANLKDEALEFLNGSTEAELKASADKLVAMGLVKSTETQVKVDEQGNPLSTQPVVKERNNPGDPAPKTTQETSVEDFLKDFEGQNATAL